MPESIYAHLDRIEAKLDALIAALAQDDEVEQPSANLDGSHAGSERDQNQPL